ncbi:UDP-glycosyltransferase 75D1 [Acorus calamus]|uniref:UDP-glycosyltransferase 75D1 n=1 Tax=Acorus calamus TaxID=4465 RepID=A0AAV9F354_ACOCL|nr:UDP-glycosyltransferase 75D1 [Acorus calamus]
MVGIGPLVRDPSDADSRGDLLERDGKDYKGWLDAKAGKSVVYVSFGTLVVLPKKQMEEMHKGLVESGRTSCGWCAGRKKTSSRMTCK